MSKCFIYGACIVIGLFVTGSFSQILTRQNTAACGGGVVLSGESGSIKSPNYPLYYNDLFCKWSIFSSPDKIIDVTFISFELEDSFDCSFDYVEILDGPILYTGLRACGNRSPRNFLSFSNNVTIIFRTDRSVVDEGFAIQWEFTNRSLIPGHLGHACFGDGAVLRIPRGYLHSPNYPRDYPSDLACNWTIIAPSDKVIEVNFQDFALEDHSACRYDYLNVTDGGEQYTGSTFCGSRFPRDFASHTSTVNIIFHSDVSVNDRGFLIGWEFKDRCADNQFTCWDGTCVPLSWKCDGRMGCSDNSDEIECAQESNDLSECGKQNVAPKFTSSPRIIGGSRATSGSWPWQALLLNLASNRSFCEGSVIHPRLILTAAHCTSDWSHRDLGIVVGRYKFTGNVGEQFLRVSRIIQHPDYSNTTYANDIGLLQLDSDITYTKYIRPICYARSSEVNPRAGETCIAAGLGAASGHAFPDALYQVRLPIVGHRLCMDAYTHATSPAGENQICTGAFGQGGVDTCQGDSGGPLMCLRKETWYQVGVTSNGVDCGRPDFPGLSTKVSSYASWIEQETYTAEACTTGTVLTAPSGSFASPNYPGNYLERSICRWNIIASIGQTIGIQFADFQLTSQCYGGNGDYLQIFDGEETRNRTCGTLRPSDFESVTNNVTILFISDGVDNEKGFSLNWTITRSLPQTTTNYRQQRITTTTAPSVASALEFCRYLPALSLLALAVQFGV